MDLAGTVPLQVPIVFVSGHSDGATLAEAVKLRPAGYVVKPFTPQQLVAAVDVAAAQSTRASLSPAVDLLRSPSSPPSPRENATSSSSSCSTSASPPSRRPSS